MPLKAPKALTLGPWWWHAALAVLLLLAGGRAAAGGPPGVLALPPGHYAFRSYGTEQGLRNLAVYALAQDTQGFLWAGTEDGLFRFDGQRFERFGAPQGLPGDEVQSVVAAPHGRLWVATAGGLALGEGGAFRRLGREHGLPEADLYAVAVQADGTVYAGFEEGLFRGDAGGGAFVRVAGYPAGRAAAVWVSPSGDTLYAVQANRLLWREGDQGPWHARALPDAHRVAALVRDGQGRLWLRAHAALWTLASPGAPLEDRTAELPGPAVLNAQLHLDAQGRVWVPTQLGVVCFERGGALRLGEESGLPTHWVEAVLVDREGSLWLASEGVHRVQGRLAVSAYTRRTGLPADTVWDVLRDRSGALWVGTQAGLARGTARGWEPVAPWGNHAVFALHEDADGGLWVGGDGASRTRSRLLHLPAGARAWREVPLALAPGRNSVSALARGPDGALYVGTLRQGLHRLVTRPSGAAGSEPVALPDAPAHEQIDSLLVDRAGVLWVAGSGGLARFDGAGWRRYGVRDGLLDPHPAMLAQDPRDGALWVSYWSAYGLSRFHPETGHGEPFSAAPELAGDTVYSLGTDARGRLWLGTASGVKRWDGARVDHFTRGDGVPGEDCSGGALWVDPRTGDVWVGMSSGLARFEARREGGPPPAPAAVLAGLAQRGRSAEVHLAVPSYANPAQLHPQVRLVGFEDAWRDTEPGRLHFSALPPGDFRLEARARLGPGAYGPTAALALHVPAPAWQHPLVLLAAALALAGLVALVFRWRLGRLERENVRLEQLVRERTRDLEEATLVDPLTGARNRRFLRLTLPEEVSRVLRRWRAWGREPGAPPPNADLVFFLVDFDHFKQVNDTWGHAAGDRVLQQACSVLGQALRETDTLVRWGGEEFLVVAQQTDRRGAEAIATKLCEAVRAHAFDVGNGERLRRTVSVGFAAFPFFPAAPDALGWEEVLEVADRCLYAAKRSGRDGWVGLVCPSLLAAPDVRGLDARDLDGLLATGAVELASSFAADGRALVR